MGLNEELLWRCRRSGAPLIEDGKAVFIWFGETAPYLMGDFNGWDDNDPVAMQMVEENIWFFELELADDAYIEYIYINDQQERVFDPLITGKCRTVSARPIISSTCPAESQRPGWCAAMDSIRSPSAIQLFRPGICWSGGSGLSIFTNRQSMTRFH